MYVKAGESTVCQHHKAEEPQICMQTIAKVKDVDAVRVAMRACGGGRVGWLMEVVVAWTAQVRARRLPVQMLGPVLADAHTLGAAEGGVTVGWPVPAVLLLLRV